MCLPQMCLSLSEPFSDEDMISLASSMSLTYAPTSAYGIMGSSRLGSDSPILEAPNSPNDDFSHITHQLQALERCSDLQEVDEENETQTTPKAKANQATKGESFYISQYSPSPPRAHNKNFNVFACFLS